jgi:hypothetical protein
MSHQVHSLGPLILYLAHIVVFLAQQILYFVLYSPSLITFPHMGS